MYTLPCAKQMASGKLPCNTGSSAHCSVGPRGVGWEWREAQGRGDVCILTADSHCGTVETNPSL